MRRIIVVFGLALSLALSLQVGAHGRPADPYDDHDPCPDGYPIKGNLTTDDGEAIDHVPSGDFDNVTNPEEYFAGEDDALAAGYRPSYR